MILRNPEYLKFALLEFIACILKPRQEYWVSIAWYLPRAQITHISKDLTYKMEGQPPKKEVKWVLGIFGANLPVAKKNG